MPSSAQMDIQSAADSSMEPLKLNFEPVRFFASQSILLRSTMTIQSLEVGTLEQEQYRYVARRTAQSQQLFRRHLHKILDGFPKIREQYPRVQRVSVPAYSRMLKKGNLASTIFEELTAYPALSAENLCVEISADILFEDLEPLAAELHRVRQMGVAVALWELGDPFCPLLRLQELPYDYLMLDPYAVGLLAKDQKEAFSGLCSFLHLQEKTGVLAVNLPSGALAESAEALGCDGYSLAPDADPIPDEEGDA